MDTTRQQSSQELVCAWLLHVVKRHNGEAFTVVPGVHPYLSRDRTTNYPQRTLIRVPVVPVDGARRHKLYITR